MLSIRPRWAELIYSGRKTIEWRHTYPEGAGAVFLYECDPVRRIGVTGIMRIGDIREVDARSVPKDLLERGCPVQGKTPRGTQRIQPQLLPGTQGVFRKIPKKISSKEGRMKAGRKPNLTFSEQVKLRSIQAAFGKDSPEEAQFWEQASTSAKLRRAIKRGKSIKPKPRKYKCYKDAHNAANRAYYQRHKDKVSEKNRRWYERNKERKKAYYNEHKERIRTYYQEWYDEQKDK